MKIPHIRHDEAKPSAQAAEPGSDNKRISDEVRVREILAEVRPLAAEYYRLTGKPLGVTGEVAEYVAADLLGLELVPPRTEGYDALRRTVDGVEHIQIKGRAYDPAAGRNQRIGKIKPEGRCDAVMLVLLNNASLEPIEIWEATFPAVVARLAEPGSRARNERGALSVIDFKRIGRRVWTATAGREEVLYFAYGSNMDPDQMQTRCPAAEVVGIGWLPDHVLCFPRHSSTRQCGVASVVPSPGHQTWGVVYRLTADCLAALDKNEGFRLDRPEQENPYNRVEAEVTVGGTATKVTTYVAVKQDAPPLPSLAYLSHLRRGARHHGLPAAYVEFLDNLVCG